MVIFCSLPVPLSFAVTCKIPLASISKITSTCGTPLGAGGEQTQPADSKVEDVPFEEVK